MDDRPRVVAVVPAKDRADTVGATVTALLGIPEVGEVLVVDDGSGDGTADAARRAGAWVLRLPHNRGKGGAVAAAVAATPETDVYLLVDADVGATAGQAGALLSPVLGGAADMTVGVLPAAGGRGGFGLVRRLAGAGIRRGAGGWSPRAPLSGQRAVRGPLLRSLGLAPRFGIEVGLTVDAVRAGARVAEVRVAMDHRHTGRRLSGFVHRGRQGADAARALWPRLTSARARAGFTALVLALALVAVSWSGSRWAPSSVPPGAGAGKVLLVGIPGLAWDDVGSGTMPNLDRLAAAGAVAAMSVRTRSRLPTVGEGYASLGAGSRVHVGPAADDAVPRDSRLVVPAVGALRAEAGRHLPTLPGDLGEALHAAGKRTAVVGNAELAQNLVGLPQGRHPTAARPPVVALMDHTGTVDGGDLSSDLLVDDQAPFGHAADLPAVAEQARAALAGADVVLVDPGDLDRASALAQISSASYAARARARALTATDQLLGRLTVDLPPGTLVLVVSVVPPGDEWRLTPVVAAGAGVVPGYLHSPSTKRLGLVALTDVAPTVLAAVGAPVPSAMVGAPLRFHPGPVDLPRLARLDRDAAYRERIWLPVSVAFIVFQVVVWGLIGLALAGRAPWARRPWLRAAALAVAAFPLATFVFRSLAFGPGTGTAGTALLVVLDGAVVVVASRARRHALSPLAWILGATTALLVADVATGARLQLASILGYAPQTAYRFSGIGNTAFATLAAATLLAVALHVHHAPRRADAVVTAAAVLALVAFVDGAPSLGNDVGGILTLVPIFGLTLLALSGRRVSWRAVGVAGAATVAVLALATAVDLARPPEARTHLGRLAAETIHHGRGSLFTTMVRKAEVNLGVLRQSPFIPFVPVIGVLALVLVLRHGLIGSLAPPGSPHRVGLVAALAAGFVGFALNDSGVIVTALVLVEVIPFIALLALADRPGAPVLLEPLEEPLPAAAAAVSPPPGPAVG